MAQPGFRQTMAAYIAQAAQARGIDPNVALQVARAEGLNSDDPAHQSGIVTNGVQEPSYGPFQLNFAGGLGSQMLKSTGIDARKPENWRAGVDYALNEAAKNGWGAFHGAQAVRLSNQAGIGRNAITKPISAPDTAAAYAGGAPLSPAQQAAANLASGQPQPTQRTLAYTPGRRMPSGSDVAGLQQQLLSAGYNLGKTGPRGNGVDGKYGPLTSAAVRAFQRDNQHLYPNLSIDRGIAGPQVQNALAVRSALSGIPGAPDPFGSLPTPSVSPTDYGFGNIPGAPAGPAGGSPAVVDPRMVPATQPVTSDPGAGGRYTLNWGQLGAPGGPGGGPAPPPGYISPAAGAQAAAGYNDLTGGGSPSPVTADEAAAAASQNVPVPATIYQPPPPLPRQRPMSPAELAAAAGSTPTAPPVPALGAPNPMPDVTPSMPPPGAFQRNPDGTIAAAVPGPQSPAAGALAASGLQGYSGPTGLNSLSLANARRNLAPVGQAVSSASQWLRQQLGIDPTPAAAVPGGPMGPASPIYSGFTPQSDITSSLVNMISRPADQFSNGFGPAPAFTPSIGVGPISMAGLTLTRPGWTAANVAGGMPATPSMIPQAQPQLTQALNSSIGAALAPGGPGYSVMSQAPASQPSVTPSWGMGSGSGWNNVGTGGGIGGGGGGYSGTDGSQAGSNAQGFANYFGMPYSAYQDAMAQAQQQAQQPGYGYSGGYY